MPLLEKIHSSQWQTWKHFLHYRSKTILWCFLIFLICEGTIFNLPYWKTRSMKPEFYTSTQLTVNSSLEKTNDGLRVIKIDPKPAIIISTTDRSLRYANLLVNKNADPKQVFWYSIVTYYSHDDTPHYGSASLPLLATEHQDHYINLGNYVKHAEIIFNNTYPGEILPFSQVIINPHIPFSINRSRSAFCFFIFILIILLGASSPLYRERLDLHSAFQILILGITTLMLMAFYVITWKIPNNAHEWIINTQVPPSYWTDHQEYDRLANALLHGHLWLNLPDAANLTSVKNPYSLLQRTLFVQHHPDTRIYLDHAYYKGHYYCYFGVIPAIIFFMPYEILSGGQWLPSAYAILISVLLGAIFATLFVTRLAKTYFKDPSLGAVMFGIWMMGIGSGILYHVFTCSFYSVPEAASYMFTLAALWCWLSSIKHPNKVSIPWVFFGSLFMACNLGCRPQFIFAALLAIPIYWNAVFKDRSLFSRRGFWPTVMAILPFVLVFVPLMMYNVARFGSPLNFGNKYQLTCADEEVAHFSYIGVLEGIFFYLFQPTTVSAMFPFVAPGPSETPQWLFQMMPVGGLFTAVAPFACILFAWPSLLKKKYQQIFVESYKSIDHHQTKKQVFWLIITLLFLGIVVLLFDCYIGGVSGVYMIDFAYLFVLAAIIVFFIMTPLSLTERKSMQGLVCRGVIYACSFLMISTVILEFFWSFSPIRNCNVLISDPQHYFEVARWFLFMN